MSSQQYHSDLKRKTRQRIDAETKAGELRRREASKRSAATKARADAARTKIESSVRRKLREADRHEADADRAGSEAAAWQVKAVRYAREEADLQGKLLRAEQAERSTAERRAERARQAAHRAEEAERSLLQQRLDAAEAGIDAALRQLRTPKPERLRVLMLAASPEGDLRVNREQSRIRNAVERALHRDLVELDVRPSATREDLLDGITRFRPHVVHFSGHSNDDLIVFEDDVDARHQGVIVSAKAFARAVTATDDPPLLVLLNSCNSARQAHALVNEGVIPFAIGMSDEIGDGDAITYATQFYASVANGQSIASSHASGQAAVELAGLQGHALPVLAHASDVDPGTAILVKPPED